jgi:carbamoyltransferase
MVIVGISGILSEAAAAVIRDGRLVASIEEKKIARRHVPGEFPEQSLAYCLQEAKADPSAVQMLVVVRPLAAAPESPLHVQLRRRFPNSQVIFVDHHLAHAAAAYYASPFDDATVLTLDRAGDLRCGARWKASGIQLTPDRELFFPDSLGDVYGRVTELLGYEAGADEHKVQWLSPSGDNRFQSLFSEIFSGGDADWPRLDRSYFDGDRLSHGAFSSRFYERLGIQDAAAVPQELYPHIAAGLQRAVEDVVIRMAGEGERLCLGGGLGLNALLVAALERSGRWKDVFVQPVAGNAGCSIGAAVYALHNQCGQTARVRMDDLFLGPGFTAEEIKQVLENCKLRFRYLLTTGELIDTAVQELNDNKIVAWMHGRTELGPRALGNRSILASPLDPYSTENLNVYIKHREPFRKFAASVPEELASEYFETGPNARFLATVGKIKPAHKERFAAATLGENLIRVHTVRQEDNPLYWRLLHAAGAATGLPVLYNTSFNLFGEALVSSPRDAVRSFYASGIDAMFVGHFLLRK